MSGTTTTAFDEEGIQAVAFEAFVPTVNRVRLRRLEVNSKFTLKHPESIRTQDSCIENLIRSMDSFGKGGKKGKKGKKGKGDGKNVKKEVQHQNQRLNPTKAVVCWHCGKKGHSSTECWSNPKNQNGSGGFQNKGGKGQPTNLTGKGVVSLEQGEQVAVVEPQPQPVLESSLRLASIEFFVRTPQLDHEG